MNKLLYRSLNFACHWLTGIAQVKDNQPVGERGLKIGFNLWNGAVKGEYNVATKEWDSFCPVWHTGQAVKALAMAGTVLNKLELIEAAEFSAEFIIKNRATRENDQGLILAFEDHLDKVNVSAVLETLDGLFCLSEATGSGKYGRVAIESLDWCSRKAYVGNGLFEDLYDPASGSFIDKPYGPWGARPLLDDAVFIKGWKFTGNDSFRQIGIDTAKTLLQDENPVGNWIKYGPCSSKGQRIHPRHAYWWGMPMLEVYKATGDERFLQCFFRSVNWYKKALRKDGGFIRNTYTDFNTDSFGHATSGTACAVICFLKYYEYTGDKRIIEYIESGLEYCMKMQFTNPEDPNLKGAILEKILPPDGTDRSPYYIRDLGTIFFIQAAALYLQTFKKTQLSAAGSYAAADHQLHAIADLHV